SSLEELPYYSPVRDYVMKAINFLAALCPDGPFEPYGLQRWRRDSDGVFRRQTLSEPPWTSCFAKHMEQFHSWDEHQVAVDQFKTDPVIAPQLDNLVGAGGGLHRVAPIDNLIWRIPCTTGGIR